MTTAASAPARAEEDPGAGRSPHVLAIVVTHRGRRWLGHCLAALDAQTYGGLDVLVVDDATPDWRDSPQLRRVAKRHLRRRRWGFMRTRRPQGFGGAINYALSRVRTDADLLLFLHDDVVLYGSAVESMVARLGRDDSTAIVGPKVVAWTDAGKLEEVGMAVDRLGYPYKGLERDEIDSGQHDVATEAFFVTSTCMLMRHDVFRDLRGWDARMRAFSEDLDLCWRARLRGHLVVVEPAARARHAMALATGQRESPFTPMRYYSRRNRLRAVAKNASAARLLTLVPQYVLVSFSEMLGFVVLRQPAEIVNLLKALAWNLVSAPQTLSERLRVQRARTVGDRRLQRLTVRETTRLRAYLGSQAERLEQAWGRSTELVARRSNEAAALSRNLRAWQISAAAVILLGLVIGYRHFLWSPPAAVGDLLPFPERATELWRAWLAPWRDVGLGQAGPAPPAFLLLGIFPVATFGAAAAAQKLLIGCLGALAFWGAYRLVAPAGDRAARVTSGLAYLLGGVGYAGIRAGDLGALAFGAAAPYALIALLSATGWRGRSSSDGSQSVARCAVTAALCGAFVPGALVLLGVLAILLAGLRAAAAPRAGALRGLAWSLGGVALAWVLLLPWSSTWLAPGAPLRPLVDQGAAQVTAQHFASRGAATVLIGRTPEAPAPLGAALALTAVLALVLGSGARRRLGLALAAVVVASAWLVAAIAAGEIPPVVATPAQAGVPAAAGLAGLAGLAVAAFRVDLPRRRLGLMQASGIGGLALAAALALLAVVPALWRGEWEPGRGEVRVPSDAVVRADSVLRAEASPERSFRALWVGPGWFGRGGEATYTLTGSGTPQLTSLYSSDVGPGAAQLADAVSSVAAGTTDLGGHALGAFNIRFVVVQRAPGAGRWLQQRDLALIRGEPEYSLLENVALLPRAATYDRLPNYVRVLEAHDARLAVGPAAHTEAVAQRRSALSWRAGDAAGPGVVWLASAEDERWGASVEGRGLRRVDGGWGNAFALPSGAAGELVLAYDRSAADVLWPLAFALLWIVALGAAFAGVRAAPPAEVAR